MNKKVIDNTLKSIGLRCKSKRLKYKWTQRQLAKVIGCAQQTICDFEKGRLNNLYLFASYEFYFGEPL